MGTNNKLAAVIDIGGLSPINSAGYRDLDTLVGGKVADLINWGTGFAALVAVIFLVIAGYTYITAAGDADKIEKAGKTITASIVGLVIVFIARVLVELVLQKIME